MKKGIIAIIGLILVISIVIVIEKFISFSNLQTITKNPFSTLEILGERINLKENERTYQTEIDCSTLTDPNTQVISYNLKEKYASSKITITTKVFNNNTLLTSDYQNITDIDTNISIVDPKSQYEQVFHFISKCKTE